MRALPLLPMLDAPLGGGAFWLAGGAFCLALLAPGVHGELPPFDNSPEVYSFESYYTVARWLLLTVLLLHLGLPWLLLFGEEFNIFS